MGTWGSALVVLCAALFAASRGAHAAAAAAATKSPIIPAMRNLTLLNMFRGEWAVRDKEANSTQQTTPPTTTTAGSNATAANKTASPLSTSEGLLFLHKIEQQRDAAKVGSSKCDLIEAELVLRNGRFLGGRSYSAKMYGLFDPEDGLLLLYSSYLATSSNRVSHTLAFGPLGQSLDALHSLPAGDKKDKAKDALVETFVNGTLLTQEMSEKVRAAGKNKCPLLMAMQLSLNSRAVISFDNTQPKNDAEREHNLHEIQEYGAPLSHVLLSGVLVGQGQCQLNISVNARYVSTEEEELLTAIFSALTLVVCTIDLSVFFMQMTATSSSQAVCCRCWAQHKEKSTKVVASWWVMLMHCVTTVGEQVSARLHGVAMPDRPVCLCWAPQSHRLLQFVPHHPQPRKQALLCHVRVSGDNRRPHVAGVCEHSVHVLFEVQPDGHAVPVPAAQSAQRPHLHSERRLCAAAHLARVYQVLFVPNTCRVNQTDLFKQSATNVLPKQMLRCLPASL